MYTRFVVDPEDAANKEYFRLILNKDGKGIYERNGDKYNLTWTSEGYKILVTAKFIVVIIKYNVSVKDGILTLLNGDRKIHLQCNIYISKIIKENIFSLYNLV